MQFEQSQVLGPTSTDIDKEADVVITVMGKILGQNEGIFVIMSVAVMGAIALSNTVK